MIKTLFYINFDPTVTLCICMCMSVCRYVCMFVCMYECMYVYVYVCAYAYACTVNIKEYVKCGGLRYL